MNSKVLFVLPDFSGGGAERVLINLITQLHYRGRDVELIVFSGSGYLSSMIPSTIPVHDLGTKVLRYSISGLVRKIRLIRPQFIFSTLGYVNLALLFMRPLLSKGTRIWVREANLPSISLRNNPYFSFMWLCYFLLYRSADRVLCTSERMRVEFADDFHIPVTKLFLLSNPVNEDVVRQKASNLIRDKGRGVRYVAAGRLTYQKGFDRLLFWFSSLEDKEAILRIFGEGPLEPILKKLSQRLGISKQVFFSGYSSDLWSWIAGADAFLLSSRWEGMPNVVLEALACGTTVIATADSGGISEVKDQVGSASVIVVKTPEEFISAIRSIQPNPVDTLRVSVLPECYKIDNVIILLEKWFDE